MIIYPPAVGSPVGIWAIGCMGLATNSNLLPYLPPGGLFDTPVSTYPRVYYVSGSHISLVWVPS
jgi:hypothetical protein